MRLAILLTILALLTMGAALTSCSSPSTVENELLKTIQVKPRGAWPPPDFGFGTLSDAARDGDPKRMKELLANGANRKFLNDALFEAARFAPLVLAAGDGRHPPSYEDHLKAQREFQLPYAQVVSLLLQNGANLEARDQGGNTPLIVAAGYGQIEVVRLLLAKGAAVEAANKEGVTALTWAACNCPIVNMPDTHESIELLLEHGANIEARDHPGTTPLIHAAGWGRDYNVKLLLDKGANIEARDNHGNTALLVAATGSAYPTADAVALLLKRSANIEVRNDDGDTALILAASHGGTDELQIVKMLLAHGADVRAKNNQGRTPLDLAVQNGRTQIVALLKAAAAKPH